MFSLREGILLHTAATDKTRWFFVVVVVVVVVVLVSNCILRTPARIANVSVM